MASLTKQETQSRKHKAPEHGTRNTEHGTQTKQKTKNKKQK
jgi:hypothetical protein